MQPWYERVIPFSSRTVHDSSRTHTVRPSAVISRYSLTQMLSSCVSSSSFSAITQSRSSGCRMVAKKSGSAQDSTGYPNIATARSLMYSDAFVVLVRRPVHRDGNRLQELAVSLLRCAVLLEESGVRDRHADVRGDGREQSGIGLVVARVALGRLHTEHADRGFAGQDRDSEVRALRQRRRVALRPRRTRRFRVAAVPPASAAPSKSGRRRAARSGVPRAPPVRCRTGTRSSADPRRGGRCT